MNALVKPVLVPIDAIQNRILLIRGQRVMMDYDLAALYGVTTARLNEQVRRNAERFPENAWGCAPPCLAGSARAT